jgi:hypothetical protein
MRWAGQDLERPKHHWEDNIKIDIKVIGKGDIHYFLGIETGDGLL